MIGLVLEGGGMRGLFTAGVLDAFLDQQIAVDRTYGVSAGACNMISYYTAQHGRNRKINTSYVNDKRYMGFGSLLKTGSFFNERFMFHDIARELVPFDFAKYKALDPDAYAVAASLKTGKSVYLRLPADLYDEYQPLLASMSLPLLAKPVSYQGDLLLDGGVTDPIPAEKALQDGCDKLIIVATREKGYQKKPEPLMKLGKLLYRKYPAFVKALDDRHTVYNAETALIDRLEAEGKAFVLRPERPVEVGRTEKDVEKLNALYQDGYDQTIRRLHDLRAYLDR